MKIRIFLASAAMLCSAVMLSHIHAAAENIRRTPVFSGIEQFELPMGTPESWENPEEGVFYYYDIDGIAVTGEVMIGDTPYLFAPDGQQCTGWQTVFGKRYFYDVLTGQPQFGWISYLDRYYYVDAANGKQSDTQAALPSLQGNSDTPYYALDEYGILQTGFFTESDGSRYYADPATGEMAFGTVDIDGVPYRFDKDGKQLTGWQNCNANLYYFDPETGESQLGWMEWNGSRYYITPEGGKQIGEIVADGIPYVLDNFGRQKTGFRTLSDGTVHCYDTDGTALCGLQTVQGSTYLFSEDGAMETGWQTVGTDTYYFQTSSGAATVGAAQIDGSSYHFSASGALEYGLIQDGGSTYYAGENGVLQTGWITLDSQRYYFHPESYLAVTGIAFIDNTPYCFSASGEMQYGLADAGTGLCYAGTDGALQTGWIRVGQEQYYFQPKTYLAAQGFTAIDGKKYYFQSSGCMARGWIQNGTEYAYADEFGVIQDDLYKQSTAPYNPMTVLKADSVTNLNGVTTYQYFIRNHNVYNIDLPNYRMTDVIGVTVHNTPRVTANTGTTQAEQYTRATINGNMNDVRVHYYVDENCAWQNSSHAFTGWHAADGAGDGNRKTISIECIMASSTDATSLKAEDNCARLAAYLLFLYHKDVSSLYTHTHWLNVRDGKTGSTDYLNTASHPYKMCPYYILPHWNSFKAKVQQYIDILNAKG